MRPRLRLRHVTVPLYAIGLAALIVALAAGTTAITTGATTDAFLAYALAVVLTTPAFWWWRIAPRGKHTRAAYHELETAIDTAPPGPLRCGQHILTARPSRLLPELLRQHIDDDPSITDSYTLLWASPLVLHHSGTGQPITARALARYTWHTLATGQTFLDADEMRVLATQLHQAQPDRIRQGTPSHE